MSNPRVPPPAAGSVLRRVHTCAPHAHHGLHPFTDLCCCCAPAGLSHACRQGRMERWNSSSGKWRQGHLVLTRAGFLHFFLPESAAAKAAALSHGGPSAANGSSSGVGADGGAAGEGGGGGGGAPSGGGSAASLPSVPSGGQLPWGGADSWTAPLESLNLSRCSFEEGEPRRVAQRSPLQPQVLQPQVLQPPCNCALPVPRCPSPSFRFLFPAAPRCPQLCLPPCRRCPRVSHHRGSGGRAGRVCPLFGAAAHADAARRQRGVLHGLGHRHSGGNRLLHAVTQAATPAEAAAAAAPVAWFPARGPVAATSSYHFQTATLRTPFLILSSTT